MPPSQDDRQPTGADAPTPPAAPRRRVIFPWAWLGLLIGARLALQLTDVTIDFKALATMATVVLSVIGLALWYAVRGRGPVWLRLAVAVAPFAFIYGFSSMYELRHGGDGWIVGVHRRGTLEPDERLERLDAASPDEGLADWGPGGYDYPRFLGSGPWAEAVGPPIDDDWRADPPEELWRRPIGAGWSSFAVYGGYAVTQEQRGDEELVVCYRSLTGEPVWSHADKVRYDPDNFAAEMGRAGPRATPTLVGDRVYTQGATGLVNCLDARTGDVVWSIDTAERYGADVPIWGKSGSPLYVESGQEGGDGLVIVNVGAPDGADDAEGYDASLVAFNAETGDEVWRSGDRQTSYASPQLVTLAGEKVILQTCDNEMTANAAADGRLLFSHPWSGLSDDRPSCSQPLQVGPDRLLLTKGYGHGASLLGVSRDGDRWNAAPLWSPPIRMVLQTKYSNAVVRDGHAYGLNGTVLQCAEIETGRVVWKERRRPSFGFGQLMLAGDHLLLLTEQGEVVLADATPERYRERAALQALDEAETCWNNPALAGDLLLVRNSAEAAAYRLPLADSGNDGEAVNEGSVASR